MENKYQRLIASYDKIIKNLILEYECWKMCASFFSGEKICFSKKGTSTVINSIFRKLSTPGSLTILEILTLILYQIETDTFNESIPLLLCLLSEENSNETTPSQSYNDFSTLRNYVGRLILDLPMPTILKLLTSYTEETPLVKKVDLYCQNINISSRDEIVEATLEPNFLLALNLSKRSSNINNFQELNSIQKDIDKTQQTLLDLTPCLPSKTKLKDKFFSSESDKSSHKNRKKEIDSLSTQTGSTLLDIHQENEVSKEQISKINRNSKVKYIDSSEEGHASNDESFVGHIGLNNHSVKHAPTHLDNAMGKNASLNSLKKKTDVRKGTSAEKGKRDPCPINDKSASDSKLINAKHRKLHNEKDDPVEFTPVNSEKKSSLGKKSMRKKIDHLNQFFRDQNHDSKKNVSISGDSKIANREDLLSKRKKDSSQSSTSSLTTRSRGISAFDFSDSEDFKYKKRRYSPRQRGFTRNENLRPRNKRLAWSLAEEEILVQGVEKYGVGQWKNIIRSGNLNLRSVRDCYDKWKNIIKYGHLQNIKARIQRKAENERHS